MNTDTDTPNAGAGTDSPNLDPTVVFSILSNPRRRHALDYLAKRLGAVPLGELAEQIAIVEGDPSRDRYERIVTGLFHVHLPPMIDAGVVRYDPKRETVALRATSEQLAPYLEVARGADGR